MARLTFHDPDGNSHEAGGGPIAVAYSRTGEIILAIASGDKSAYDLRLSYDEAATLMQHLHLTMKLSIERGS